MAQPIQRAVLRIGVVLAAVGVAVGVFLFGGDKVPEVDFKTAAPRKETVSENDNRPLLKVAIGAMISPSITKQYYETLFELVGERLGKRTVLVQRKTYAQVNELIENREIDLAFICSGPYVQGHEKYGLEIIAVPVVGGQKVYFSYILANVDSSIRTFDDMRGKRFAFTDPDSNTGCLVPKFMLAKRGEAPETFFRETFFTYSHDNSIKAVTDKLADGAAVDSLIWDFMRATDPASVSKTVKIHQSPPYGIPPLVVHPSLDSALKTRLKEVLLSLHKDARAKALLDKVRIDKFEEGNDAFYETVREMQSWQKERI